MKYADQGVRPLYQRVLSQAGFIASCINECLKNFFSYLHPHTLYKNQLNSIRCIEKTIQTTDQSPNQVILKKSLFQLTLETGSHNCFTKKPSPASLQSHHSIFPMLYLVCSFILSSLWTQEGSAVWALVKGEQSWRFLSKKHQISNPAKDEPSWLFHGRGERKHSL